MTHRPKPNLSATFGADIAHENRSKLYKNKALPPPPPNSSQSASRLAKPAALAFPVVSFLQAKFSFFPKLLLMIALMLLFLVGQASAQRISLRHVTDGTEGIVFGQGTQIVIEVSQTGITQSVNAIQIAFEFDQSLLSLAAPTGWLSSGDDTVILLSITPAPVPASARFTFTTKVDVTGQTFSIGLKTVTLDVVTIPTSVKIPFNSVRPPLHLDTQIESPVQNNSVLTFTSKRPGDTLQIQLFVPDAAGQDIHAFDLELTLQGKRFTSFIGNISGSDWMGGSLLSGLSTSDNNPTLNGLFPNAATVPITGYLGQIDLELTGVLTEEDTLSVKRASLAVVGGTQQPLDVFNAALSFAPPLCPGDFDKNGMVNIPDFLLFVGAFGTSSGDATYNALMDMDGNGMVNIPDFLLFVGVFGTTCDTIPPPPPPGPTISDRDALVALYNATNGSDWTNKTNWLSSKPLGEWHGVSTDGRGRVTRIDLPDNRLNGHIPVELGSLDNLIHLWLGGNQLSGAIPVELGSLDNLIQLWLGDNQLSGAIPVELGSLDNLIQLSLYDNQLSGAIPVELGSLDNLISLSLYGNQLSGAIPVELGSLDNLTQLLLGGNQLSGAIPVELGSLDNLISLHLGGNQLSAIPVELGSLDNLTYLSLSDNQLSGAIPVELGSLDNLISLSLYRNQLSGAIPVELGSLDNLETLWLGGNQLSGAIPVELGSLDNLTQLLLDDNQLSGAIPVELGSLDNLISLHLRGNADLSGALPGSFTGLGNLTILSVGGTGLCAPTDATFQTWLQGIANKSGVTNCAGP